MQKSIFDKAADNVRILTAAMVEKAKSGHPGGSMGGADFVNVLYSKYLITDPDVPMWISRDASSSTRATCRRCSIRCLRLRASTLSTS